MELNVAVGEPTPATAIVVDLRGFTRELNETNNEDGSRAKFCALLAKMNAAVIVCSRMALHPPLRERFEELVHVGATGDGALIVFTDVDHHARHAALAALLIRRVLEQECGRYNVIARQPMDFGIGVESGTIRMVGAGPPHGFATTIGGCINLAARIQGLTKVIDRTHVVYGSGFVEEMLEDLYHEDYHQVVRNVPSGSLTDDEYLANERRRIALNRRMCMNFLHMHKADGFLESRALFRLSKSSGVVGNPRFDAMLCLLVDSEEGWRDEVVAVLR